MRSLIPAIAATVLLLGAGCQTTPVERAPEQQKPEVAKPDSDGVQRVRVVGGSYFFKPSHIIVKANVPVELLASREAGFAPHDLVIEGMAIKEELGTEPKKIAFTARKPGKYALYCTKKPPFGGAAHRERGMEGILEVVP